MTITHTLNLDLEDLFADDFIKLDNTSSISSIFDDSWSTLSNAEDISTDPSSPASYQSQSSYATVQSQSRWDDDRLEWINMVDATENGKFKCPKCLKLYTRKSNLKAHFAAAHIGIKRFKCLGCSRLFARRSYIKQHQRICKELS